MSFGTYWRMTINNYDATDLALVRQGYPDDIRKLVYTLEEGETGTPHIQAYIQMKRSVRLSHMKKLFPRGNFGTMDSAEWRLNQHNYAQKLDGTATSPATILNSDPLHTVEGTVRRVIMKMMADYEDVEDIGVARRYTERDLVLEDYTMAKVFVSATYKAMWKDFGNDMYECLFRKREQERQEQRVDIPSTHTHTHADEKFSHGECITEDAEHDEGESSQGGEDSSHSSQGEESYDEGDEDYFGPEVEGYDSGRSSCSGSSFDE